MNRVTAQFDQFIWSPANGKDSSVGCCMTKWFLASNKTQVYIGTTYSWGYSAKFQVRRDTIPFKEITEFMPASHTCLPPSFDFAVIDRKYVLKAPTDQYNTQLHRSSKLSRFPC